MDQSHSSRRSFIQKATLTGLAGLSLTEIIAATFPLEKSKKITLQPNDVILFQGDSITDAGRNKESNQYNESKALGSGYSLLAAGDMLHQHAGKKLQIFNKGISGNKVFQLAERWEKDCLDLKPNVLSILIGVNDYWHKHNGNYDGTVEVYKKDYMALLTKTKKVLPGVKLIIGEPFAVSGITAVDSSWYPEFDEYRKVALEIAHQFDAQFIPYQKIFDEAGKKAPGVYWTHDGVHPSLAGARLMAQAWLNTVQ